MFSSKGTVPTKNSSTGVYASLQLRTRTSLCHCHRPKLKYAMWKLDIFSQRFRVRFLVQIRPFPHFEEKQRKMFPQFQMRNRKKRGKKSSSRSFNFWITEPLPPPFVLSFFSSLSSPSSAAFSSSSAHLCRRCKKKIYRLYIERFLLFPPLSEEIKKTFPNVVKSLKISRTEISRPSLDRDHLYHDKIAENS